uniref:Uncharacterized protein n=1 Tax=Dicentrarchus labrax TaxID=13489 RepID=A0A8C4GW78_DICLA
MYFVCLPSVCTAAIFNIMLLAGGVVGVVFISDCPRQPFIPIYLLMMGVNSLLFWRFEKFNTSFCYLVFSVFFIWFIVGNVLVYSIYEPNYNKNITQANAYCDKTLYLFAFWMTNLTYVLLGVLFLSCHYCLLQQEPDEAQMPLQG